MADDEITQALTAARRALMTHHNCLITDRPDLPRSADAGWTTNFSRELQLLDEAIGLTSKCPRSPCGSSDLPTEQLSAPATHAEAPRNSRMPDQDGS